jgi:hypothetical protein
MPAALKILQGELAVLFKKKERKEEKRKKP